MNNAMESALFAAGKVAYTRGWPDCLVVTEDRIDDLAPVGNPVILVASAEQLTSDHARTLAALIGAGRQAVVVVDHEPDAAFVQWLSPELVVLASSLQRSGSGPSDALDEAQATPTIVSSPPSFLAHDVEAYCDLIEIEAGLSGDRTIIRQAEYFWDQWRELSQQGMTSVQRNAHGAMQWWAMKYMPRYERFLNINTFPSCHRQKPCLVLRTSLGNMRDMSTWSQESVDSWKRAFTREVIAYCEIPDTMKHFASLPMDGSRSVDMRAPIDSVWHDVPDTSRPSRDAEFANDVEYSWRDLAMHYLIPVTDDFECTRLVLERCIDSVCRMDELILHPESDLDGRREQTAGPRLTALLEAIGLQRSR